MKGFILKSHEAQALAAGKPVVIWRKLSRPLQEQPDGRWSWIVCSTDKAVRDMHCYSWPDPNGFSITDRGREFCEYFRRPFPVDIPLFGKETWSADAFEISYKERVGEWVKAVPEEHKAQLVRLYDTQRMSFRPPSHMPEWASRITLTLSDVKVRRPCDVTEEEAESLMPDRWCPYNLGRCQYGFIPSGNTSLEPDECRCGDMTISELFQTWFKSIKGDVNLYHFTAMATPQHQEP